MVWLAHHNVVPSWELARLPLMALSDGLARSYLTVLFDDKARSGELVLLLLLAASWSRCAQYSWLTPVLWCSQHSWLASWNGALVPLAHSIHSVLSLDVVHSNELMLSALLVHFDHLALSLDVVHSADMAL